MRASCGCTWSSFCLINSALNSRISLDENIRRYTTQNVLRGCLTRAISLIEDWPTQDQWDVKSTFDCAIKSDHQHRRRIDGAASLIWGRAGLTFTFFVKAETAKSALTAFFSAQK